MFKKARYKEAIIAYTDAIALRQDDPLVLTNRAAAFMMEEEFWRAVGGVWRAPCCPVLPHVALCVPCVHPVCTVGGGRMPLGSRGSWY